MSLPSHVHTIIAVCSAAYHLARLGRRDVLLEQGRRAWGGEPLLLEGATVGELGSVGWGPLAGACVALAYRRGTAARASHAGTPGFISLWGEPVPVRIFDQWPPKP